MSERDAGRNRGKLALYIGFARPDHWFKNLLVLAGGTVWLGGPRSMSGLPQVPLFVWPWPCWSPAWLPVQTTS